MVDSLLQRAYAGVTGSSYPFRRKKVQKCLDKKDQLHAIVLPGWLATDLENEKEGKPDHEIRVINNRAVTSAIRFYRSLGFRRIGASDYSGFSVDNHHKSSTVSPLDNFDPAMIESALSGSETPIPLHDATKARRDFECVEIYKAYAMSDSPDWRCVDGAQNNVLHLASSLRKSQRSSV